MTLPKKASTRVSEVKNKISQHYKNSTTLEITVTFLCRLIFPSMMKSHFILLISAVSLATLHNAEVVHIFEQGLPDTCLEGPLHKVSILIPKKLSIFYDNRI